MNHELTQKERSRGGKNVGKGTGPHKNGFFKEMLEEIVLGDKARFNVWAEDNFTEAVKELGKLQPRNINVGGDDDNPIITKVIVEHVNTQITATREDS